MAQGTFASRPVKLVVGYPAGGSVDLAARVTGDALAAHLKATVVVDNVGGAAGAIAAQRVVSAPADGHTLLVGPATNWWPRGWSIPPSATTDAATSRRWA